MKIERRRKHHLASQIALQGHNKVAEKMVLNAIALITDCYSKYNYEVSMKAVTEFDTDVRVNKPLRTSSMSIENTFFDQSEYPIIH